jgi:hypothetical protein
MGALRVGRTGALFNFKRHPAPTFRHSYEDGSMLGI